MELKKRKRQAVLGKYKTQIKSIKISKCIPN